MSEKATRSEIGATTPRVFSLLMLGYTLSVLGVVNLLGYGKGAVLFAFLGSSLAEIVAGIWELSRGETYAGNLITVFGFWGIGRFSLGIVGKLVGLSTPTATAIYYVMLLIPFGILYIPVFRNKLGWVYHAIFGSVMPLLLVSAISFVFESNITTMISAFLAFVAAAAVWILAARVLLSYT